VFPDALSRHPVRDPCADEEYGEDPHLVGRAIRACMQDRTNLKFHQLLTAAQADEDYQLLLQYVLTGFPEKKSSMPAALQVFWNGRDQLCTDNGMILKGTRILIPVALRPQALADLHAAHQGLTRTKSRARQTVFWPGMTSDIEEVVRSCSQCSLHGASQTKEPLRSEDRQPDLPFQHTSADLFECHGWQYLVYVDRMTGWPCVCKIGRTATSADVIRALRRWFPDVGVPDVLTTDGGPQFSSHRFSQFCTTWQIQHVKSSPHYPQSNGLAESAVKAMKSLILKTTRNGDLDVDAFQRALLEWRNTPRASGLSPAQALYGRPLESFVIAHRSSFSQEWKQKADDVNERAADRAQATQQHYDSSARPLANLHMGAHVTLQDPRTKLWSARGVIVGIGRHRDYHIKLPCGRVLWRNRRFLRPVYSPTPGRVVTPPAQPAIPDPQPEAPRRSTRPRQQRVPFNIHNTHGQSYK